MGRIVRCRAVPRTSIACVEVRESAAAPLGAILEWAAANLRGVLWWSKTQFRDPKTGPRHCHDSRKRHFQDGYWVYRFWFSRRADATVFTLCWASLDAGRA